MFLKVALIYLICSTLPQKASSERKSKPYDSGSSTEDEDGGVTIKKQGSNLTTVCIILGAVVFCFMICYGTRCFYVCKMHFFEKKEKKYTKMDLTSQV